MSYFADLPPLPLQVTTRDGQVIDTSQKVWWMRSSIWGGSRFSIRLLRLEDSRHPPILSERACYLTTLYLIHRLQRQQTSTVRGDFESVIHFGRWLSRQVEQGFLHFKQHNFNWFDLNEELVRDYIDDDEKLSRSGRNFISIRGLYQWGLAQGYRDFDESKLNVMRSISVMTRASGHVVRSWNPDKGSLSSDERWLLGMALRSEKGRQQDRILIQILLELGIRPQAMLLLRNQDLRHYNDGKATRYELAITTIKRRTPEREIKLYPITPELGCLLDQHQLHTSEAPLLHWLPSGQPDAGIRRALRRFVKEASIVTPRTGQLLNLYPYRLRYTLATYLFEIGAPKATIAAVLNHKGLGKVHVYTATTSAIANQMGKAVDPAMEPLVQRFLGQAAIERVPTGCQHLIVSAVPHLKHFQKRVDVVGVCEREQPEDCQASQPLDCYLCPFFSALKNAPHKELLEAIQSFVQYGQEDVDPRILRQHEDVQIAIKQLLNTFKSRQLSL